MSGLLIEVPNDFSSVSINPSLSVSKAEGLISFGSASAEVGEQEVKAVAIPKNAAKMSE